MPAACAGCALHERGLASFSSGDHGLAKDLLLRAVTATPTLAAAWRSLAWLETVDPATVFAKQVEYANEAGRSTVAAALCTTAASTRAKGPDNMGGSPWPKNVTKRLRGLYDKGMAADDLCPSVVSHHASLGEVADLGLGRLLCEFPGMTASGINRPLSAAERHVDLIKRYVTGYAAADGLPPVAYPAWDVQYLANWANEFHAANTAHFPFLSTAHVGSLNLFAAAVEHACSRGVAGDVLEAGVFRGGTLAVGAAQLLASSEVLSGTLGAACARKRLFAADTFQGIPPLADPTDGVAAWPDGAYAASVASVRAAWHALGLYDGPPLLTLVGRFNETIRAALARDGASPPHGVKVAATPSGPNGPSAPKGTALAVLRIDADTREGTLEALEAAYDAVSPGGVVIVDDFHLPGARQAVHAFRARRQLREPLLPAVTDYVACRSTPLRARMLAEDEVRRSRPGRVFPRHNPLRVGHMLSQYAAYGRTSDLLPAADWVASLEVRRSVSRCAGTCTG